MKKLLAVAAMASCLSMAVPAYSHHMAEGIVGDDIYVMIEENLADSPHLDLDVAIIGSGSATIGVISVTVMEEDVPTVLDTISDALAGDTAWVGDSGEGDISRERQTSLEVDISEVEDGLVTITIEENIGQGMSQSENWPELP